MFYVKVYYQVCPTCKKTWSAQLSQAKVIRLGHETFRCKCGKDWDTGRKEWAHLTREQRLSYFFSQAEYGVLAICTVTPPLFAYFIADRWRSAGMAAVYGLLVGLFFCVLLWAHKMLLVKLSLRRCPHPIADLRGGWPRNW
jgi:hypothetical protein